MVQLTVWLLLEPKSTKLKAAVDTSTPLKPPVVKAPEPSKSLGWPKSKRSVSPLFNSELDGEPSTPQPALVLPLASRRSLRLEPQPDTSAICVPFDEVSRMSAVSLPKPLLAS